MFATLTLSTLLATAPIETDCLFVLTHAGETNELLPVIEEMQRQNRDYRVIALNVAADLVKGKVPLERLVDKPIKAKKVVTGVHSEEHKYYLELYRDQAETFAYWDNPEPRGAVAYFTQALKVQALAKKVLFPSGFVASAREFQDRPAAEKIVVGKPTLLKFLNDLKQYSTADASTILFVGTYGDGYEKALELFVNSIKTLPENKPKVVFQRHPMANSNIEEKCAEAIRGSVSKIPLLEAMAQAKVVVTYNSSAGFQALVGGKPVVYVVPEGDSYSNSLIEDRCVAKATNLEEVLEALAQAKASSSPEDLLALMQVPLDPVERFFIALYPDEDHNLRPLITQN
jgi:glycosyltransferase involved in cell wall biosynthesis